MITVTSPYTARQEVFRKNQTVDWMNRLLGNRPAYHIVFWTFVFGFNVAYIAFIGEDRDISLFNLALRVPFILSCCYLNLYWLMPRFYYSGRLMIYGPLVLLTIFSFSAVNLYLLGFFVDSPVCPSTYEADATFNGSNYIYKSFYLFSIAGLTSGIKLSKDHLSEKQRAEAVEKERLRTELSFLKTQINPHFFFNTLNSLYALTIKQSELAPGMVLKLSDLMSYSLYESEGSHVSLVKEISHIRNYIELETVRLGHKVLVDFSVAGDANGHAVPPLLFLPLIENCFKHCNMNQNGAMIKIKLTISEEAINLRTENPASASPSSLNKAGGIGLRNLERRLHLLFGNTCRFESAATDQMYFAMLQIPVA
jgi:two-component system, LytTR family, sensor kinase